MHPGCVPVEAQRVEETAHMPIVVVSACSLDTYGTVLGRQYTFELEESALRISVSGVKEKRKVQRTSNLTQLFSTHLLSCYQPVLSFDDE